MIYRPALSILIGFSTGIISCLCFHHLTPKLLKCIGLYDTCGIHNLHGIPGLLGGIWSAIIVAFYNSGYDSAVAAQYSTGKLMNVNPNFLRQGGLQIAGTFCSLGMAIAFGIIAGLVAKCFYTEDSSWFYLDTTYFYGATFDDVYRDHKEGKNLYLKQVEHA
jgi:ammonium transporter Rh